MVHPSAERGACVRYHAGGGHINTAAVARARHWRAPRARPAAFFLPHRPRPRPRFVSPISFTRRLVRQGALSNDSLERSGAVASWLHHVHTAPRLFYFKRACGTPDVHAGSARPHDLEEERRPNPVRRVRLCARPYCEAASRGAAASPGSQTADGGRAMTTWSGRQRRDTCGAATSRFLEDAQDELKSGRVSVSCHARRRQGRRGLTAHRFPFQRTVHPLSPLLARWLYTRSIFSSTSSRVLPGTAYSCRTSKMLPAEPSCNWCESLRQRAVLRGAARRTPLHRAPRPTPRLCASGVVRAARRRRRPRRCAVAASPHLNSGAPHRVPSSLAGGGPRPSSPVQVNLHSTQLWWAWSLAQPPLDSSPLGTWKMLSV